MKKPRLKTRRIAWFVDDLKENNDQLEICKLLKSFLCMMLLFISGTCSGSVHPSLSVQVPGR